ncbi:MAG TPA: hypothetical protein VFE15_16410 [Marmoricola sp.]|jgi:hypothetical protein|nr:hypothetical protein [Marmoricola sp.]
MPGVSDTRVEQARLSGQRGSLGRAQTTGWSLRQDGDPVHHARVCDCGTGLVRVVGADAWQCPECVPPLESEQQWRL